MATKQESIHAGEYIRSEANGSRSRENITLAATDAVLPAGQLLGKVTASGLYVPYDPAGADGSETCAGILYAPAGSSAAEQRAVATARDAEVIGGLLTDLDEDATADLLALGIIIR